MHFAHVSLTCRQLSGRRKRAQRERLPAGAHNTTRAGRVERLVRGVLCVLHHRGRVARPPTLSFASSTAWATVPHPSVCLVRQSRPPRGPSAGFIVRHGPHSSHALAPTSSFLVIRSVRVLPFPRTIALQPRRAHDRAARRRLQALVRRRIAMLGPRSHGTQGGRRPVCHVACTSAVCTLRSCRTIRSSSPGRGTCPPFRPPCDWLTTSDQAVRSIDPNGHEPS